MTILVTLKKGMKFEGFKEGEEVEWTHPAQPSEKLFDIKVKDSIKAPVKKTFPKKKDKK